MQINYANYNDLRDVNFWNFPQIYNSIQDIDVPPIYAPYPEIGFWPAGLQGVEEQFVGTGFHAMPVEQNSYAAPLPTPQMSIAPNSGLTNTVGAAMSAASSNYFATAPPATPSIAAATGQPLAPVSLVSPMPSITALPQPATTTNSGPMCSVSSWASSNPGLAVGVIAAVFLLLRGAK